LVTNCRVADSDPDPHYFGKLNPNQHLSQN
jgi:hypothetical protein